MEYSFAQEPKALADELIPKFHDHLSRSRIEYVFLSETPKAKGKDLLGRARKKSGLDAWLAAENTDDDPQPFFVLEFSKPAWDLLTAKQKKALVDHELSHCWIDEEGALKILAHDVEEFSGVIKRHGLWQPDIQFFAEIAAKHVKQLDLPIDEPEISKKPPKETESKPKIVKANGHGQAKEPEAPQEAKTNTLSDFKNEVAKRRGGRQPRAN